MSRRVKAFIILVLILLIPSFIRQPTSIVASPFIQTSYFEKKDEVPKRTKPSFKKKSYEHFLYVLAQRESGNDWTIYNKWGYMGKYQFGDLALEDLGYGGCVTIEEFKKDPSIFPEWLQDELIVEYIKKNKRNLRRYIKNFDNTIIDSTEITESGIIAAAHLVGAGNTTKWFDNCGEIDIKDGNGVSIKEYMKTFAGYEID
jgi:hypothetical protein